MAILLLGDFPYVKVFYDFYVFLANSKPILRVSSIIYDFIS